MSEAGTHAVASADDGIRLDRWFKRHYPSLAHGRLERLLRTGQIRVDGRRAKAGMRVAAGQTVRVPPSVFAGEAHVEDRARATAHVTDADIEAITGAILYMDDDVIALNKPAGLAVQGGTNTTRHLDAMLDALRFDAAERPRLVHRLDRDTSGVMLIARSARVAAELGRVFKTKAVSKLYWAAVAGVPKPRSGTVDVALEKRPGRTGERMLVDSGGQKAVTRYRTVDHAGKRAAWLALEPLTGRTHQLRVHCAALGTPILGDGKYGGRAAFPDGIDTIQARLHLHARAIRVTRAAGNVLTVDAPLPPHMAATWDLLGFDTDAEGVPFAAAS